METIVGYPFVSHVEQTPRTMNIDVKEWLKQKYSDGYGFGIDELKRTGRYKLMGYAYNFKPYLKKYLYKQYGDWHEAYAPNKKLLRKSIYGAIDKIVEID